MKRMNPVIAMIKEIILRRGFVLLVMILGTICVPTSTFAQTVYTVNTTSDTLVPNACSSGAAGCSLRGAITAANPAGNASIVFAIPASDTSCSASFCTINLTSFLPPISGNNISITGPGNNRLTVRSTTDPFVGIIEVNSSGSVTLSGLTIAEGGSASPSSRFGGILKQGSGTLNVIACHIRNNRTISFPGGGGIVNLGGVMNVINSTIYSNQAILMPGAGIANDATLNVVNSTIYNNVANNGGGGISNRGTANITNSTIIANSAPGASGKLPGVGGGIFNAQGAVLNIKNTIVAENSAGGPGQDVFGNVASAGFNLVGKRDSSVGFTAPTDITGTIAAPLASGLDPAGLSDNGGLTLTIKLLRGSPAIDKASSLGLTGILTADQRGAGFVRTLDDGSLPNADGGDGTDIGAFENSKRPNLDFDRDGKTDISVFRPSLGTWYGLRSSDGSFFGQQAGSSTDKIVPADYTGDGKTDIAFFRPSDNTWNIIRSENQTFYALPYAAPGDIPAPADFDGDGKADITIFRPSNSLWVSLRSSDGNSTIFAFGSNGDIPVPADYDGDGKADFSVYRPSAGEWYTWRSTTNTMFGAPFGAVGDLPVQGDYTGDGKVDFAIFRPSTNFWYVLRSENQSFYGAPFASPGDIPVTGDYDGDGKNDFVVYRPSTGNWFIMGSRSGFIAYQFGDAGDKPVPAYYLP